MAFTRHVPAKTSVYFEVKQVQAHNDTEVTSGNLHLVTNFNTSTCTVLVQVPCNNGYFVIYFTSNTDIELHNTHIKICTGIMYSHHKTTVKELRWRNNAQPPTSPRSDPVPLVE